jgi:hypothetical protein
MNKMALFSEDLNISMTEVHRLLEHWGLAGWREYLVVREPTKPESFIVLAHPSDKSDFADKLVRLHKDDVSGEAPNGSNLKYLSEVFRIVEGATRGDMDKVRNYAGLLAEKLEEDGEANAAKWLRQIVEGNAGARMVPHAGGEYENS